MTRRQLTKSQIDASDGPHDPVVDSVQESVIEMDNETVANLPLWLQQIVAILDVDSEFHNGGIEQFFKNRTSRDDQISPKVQFAIDSMYSLDGTVMADILQRASERFE